MRLKRLDLHGFKTFAARAALEFAPGITVIVGPNGSGKSNVADAVRWVLGEQSLKLLRGRRSEDVIFGGGTGRAPTGLAEVTLTLDNADGLLPVDFAEVAVGRRAYRSGESEYFINRGRARLRDVTDLLARSGIGQSGHSVIGQGMVDAALSLRPEERRSLFEDAAGLRRYHLKRAEAESKLAQVRTNATRVADLLAELEPRVAQLQRQARRAQDESRLRGQWREAAAAWFAQSRWEIEAGLATTRPEAQQLMTQRTGALQRVETTALEVVSARETLAAVRAEQARQEQERAAARAAFETARRDSAVHHERLRALERGVAQIAEDLGRLTKQVQSAERELPLRAAARAEAEAALQQGRESLQTAEAALLSDRQTGQQDGAALIAARGAVTEAARRLTQVTTQLRETEHQEAALQKQRVESAAGRARATEALSNHTARLAALQAADAERSQALAALGVRRAEAGRQLAAAQRQADGSAAALATLDDEIRGLNVRLNVWQEMAQGTGSSDGAHAVSGSLARAALNHQSQPRVADFLRAPAEMEAAVAAAAGPVLDWLVVETEAEAAALALVLAANGGERRTVIARRSLERARRPPMPALPPHAGGVGYLSQMLAGAASQAPTPPHGGSLANGTAIALEAGHRNGTAHSDAETAHTRQNGATTVLGVGDRALVSALLEDAYLVDQLHHAVALARLINGERPAVLVTRAGEVVYRIGAITAGAPPGEARLLRRRREARDCQSQLDQASEARAPLAARLQTEREALAGFSRELREIEERVRQLGQQASREDGERRGLAQQQARLEKDLRWWQEFDERSDGQLRELSERVARLLPQRQAAAETHAAATAQIHVLTRTAAIREAKRAARRDQVASARTAVAVAEQRLVQERQRVSAAEGALRAARADQAAAEQRRQRAERDAAVERDAAKQAGAVLQRLESRIPALELAVAGEQMRAEVLEARLEQLRAQIEQANAEAARTERDAAMLEARRATLVERLRALGEQAARDLGELPLPVQTEETIEALAGRVEALQTRLRNLGPVNQVALQEHAEARERLEFLTGQLVDLQDTTTSLEAASAELEHSLQQDFASAFETVAEHFQVYFKRIFGGGEAQLRLTDPKDLSASGVEIQAQLPGKRRQELALLSGGERALVANALLFALLSARPSPFCFLDEVDAALDEANVVRFCDVLEELSRQTQFILITHNRGTMERAGALYGVTMGADGVSRVVSLRLDQAVARASAS